MNQHHSLGERIASWWARTATNHPFLTFLLGCLIVAVAFPGGKLIEPNFTYTAFFFEEDPNRVQFDRFTESFGSDETVVVAIHSPSGIFDEASAETVRAVTEELWQLPDVIRVDSLANFKLVRADEEQFEIEDVFPVDEELTASMIAERKRLVERHPTLPGSLVSKDLDTAMAVAFLKPLAEGTHRDAGAIAQAARDIRDRHSTADHVIHLFGVPILTDTFMRMATEDSPRMRRGAGIVGALALLLLFRRVSGLVVPMVIVVATVMTTYPMAGWLGIEITTLTGGISSLLLAVCLSITVHLMSRFYYYLRVGVTRKEAARLSIRDNMVPTFLTTVTTAIAFYSCMSAELKIVAGFGKLGGTGTLLAWLLTYTLITALLMYFPMWRPNRGAVEVEDPASLAPSARAQAYVDGLSRFRWGMVAAALLFCVVGVYAAVNVKVATNPMLTIAEGHPARESGEFILDEMGMLTFEIVVDSGKPDGIKDPAFLAKVEQLQNDLLQQPGVTSAMSVVDVLKQVHQALHGGGDDALRLAPTQAQIAQELFVFTMGLPQGVSLTDRVTVENDALRVSVSSRILQSDEHIELVTYAENRAQELGLDVYTTGLHNMYQISSVPIVRSVLRSTMLALLGVSIVLGFALRSPRLVMTSMVVNVVPLFAGALVFWLAGRPLDVGTVMGFSLALGIAVDDTVHIVVHYLEYIRRGDAVRVALAKVVSHVAPALVTTSTIIVGAAMVFLLGDYVPSFWFGTLLASILVTALATDLTLLPALFLLTERGSEDATAS